MMGWVEDRWTKNRRQLKVKLRFPMPDGEVVIKATTGRTALSTNEIGLEPRPPFVKRSAESGDRGLR